MTTTIIVLSVLLILAVAYGVAMTLHNINQAPVELLDQQRWDALADLHMLDMQHVRLELQHKALHQRFEELQETVRLSGDPETPTYNDVAVEHNVDPSAAANVQQTTADNVGEPSFADEVLHRLQRYIEFVFPGSTVDVSDPETRVVDGLEISTGVIDIHVTEDITPEEYERRLQAHPFQPTIEMLEGIERLNVAAAAEQQQPDDN